MAVPLERPVRMERRIGGLLFLLALGLYLASMSWTAFPGQPTQLLLEALGQESAPGVLNPIWNRLVRFFSGHAAVPLAAWMGAFSAVCGALGAGILGRLMVRVSYQMRGSPPPVSVIREEQARWLSGLVAGLYLTCCIPHWVAATRSLPQSFHLLLLWLAIWFFAEYRRTGSGVTLGLTGFLYGIGCVEFATFLLFLPVALFLLAREWYRRKSLLAWRVHLVFWTGLGAGLGLYAFHAAWLFRLGASAAPWRAWLEILQGQAWVISQVRFTPGFLVILFFALVPWLTLFVMSRRSPWFYESDQVLMRVVFVGGLFGILYNAPFAFWNLLGMSYLMVTPHLLLAACMGYMAGEFWILGEIQMKDASRAMRGLRRGAGVLACLLPLGVGLGGVHNWRTVDGRHSAKMGRGVDEILARLDGRDLIFSSGIRDGGGYLFLDDLLRLAIWERRLPVRVISGPKTLSTAYLRHLATGFEPEVLREQLLKGKLDGFVEGLLTSDAGPGRVAILDMPDVFPEFGYLVPDGFIYRLEATRAQADLLALLQAQRPFWAWLEEQAAHPVPEVNLARPYQDELRTMAAKVANNLGVLQAEGGDEDGALETFRTARRIEPANLSALLNLLELGRHRELPEAAELEAEWMDVQENPSGERWMLAVRHGYVWRAREWVRRGWVWVLSGMPSAGEAARRNPSGPEDVDSDFAQQIDLLYLRWGLPTRGELYYRSRLVKDAQDTGALMDLCRISLRRKDPDSAEAYMAEAMALGVPEEELGFDRAMVAHVRGQPAEYRAALEKLSRMTPGDARVWLALLMTDDAEAAVKRQAFNRLKNLAEEDAPVRLALAWVRLLGAQWAGAQADLEQVVQQESQNAKAWELLVTLAQITDNRKLFQLGMRNLLTLEPEHPFSHMRKANARHQAGDWEGAKAELRRGISQQRDPNLLNHLAHLLMVVDGDLPAARALVDEALRKQPFNPIFRCTRGELNLKEGRFDEVAADVEAVLASLPGHIPMLLLSAQLHAARGETQAALDQLRSLAGRQRELSPEQRKQLKEIALAVRKI